MDVPAETKKSGASGFNWSKTKQVARKQSAAACKEDERNEWKQLRKDQRFKDRELKKAKKLLGDDFTQRRSVRDRTQVVRDDYVQH